MTSPILVRPTEAADVSALLELQERVYPTIAPWRRDQLVRQLKVFPQGQLVAVRDGQLLGCASSLVIVWD